MASVDTFDWFLEQAKSCPDEFINSLVSDSMTSRPLVLIQAIEAAHTCLPEDKILPILINLLSKDDNTLRLCVINTIGMYYNAAVSEIDYLAIHDPDPVCRALASRIQQERGIATLIVSYVSLCIFIIGWAIFSILGYGYFYLIVSAAVSIIHFVFILSGVRGE